MAVQMASYETVMPWTHKSICFKSSALTECSLLNDISPKNDLETN